MNIVVNMAGGESMLVIKQEDGEPLPLGPLQVKKKIQTAEIFHASIKLFTGK